MKKYKMLVICCVICGVLSACSEITTDSTHTSKVDETIDKAITDKTKVEQVTVGLVPEPIKKTKKDHLIEKDIVEQASTDGYYYADIQFLHENGKYLTGQNILTVGLYDPESNSLAWNAGDRGRVYFDLVRGADIKELLPVSIKKATPVAIIGFSQYEDTSLYSATTLTHAHIVALGVEADDMKTKTADWLQDKVKQEEEKAIRAEARVDSEEEVDEAQVVITDPAQAVITWGTGDPTVTTTPPNEEEYQEDVDTSEQINSQGSEEKTYVWEVVPDVITIGATPMYRCPNCGFEHLYGVEVPTAYHKCPQCGVAIEYPAGVREW